MDEFRLHEFEAQVREILCVYKPTLAELLKAIAKYDGLLSKLRVESGPVEAPTREGQEI